jgi:hypothetical protein
MVLNLIAKPAAPSAPSAPRLPIRLITPGTYLTDGDDLFRCVSADLTGDPDGTALLEDCRTLGTFVQPLAEFDDSRLRVVRH